MACLIVCLSTAACSDLFGPGSEGHVTPRLRGLEIDNLDTSLRHGGILYIFAAPADTSFRLRQDQRVPVEIDVTSGDREEVGLYRELCPFQERIPVYHCFSFAFTMTEGAHAADLAGHVAAIGGRFTFTFASGRGGAITVFDPEDLVRRARRARSWPGVQLVELTRYSCADWAPGCLSRSHLKLPVPVDTGAAVPGDGIVQIRPGDTVTVTYRQPEGGRLEARRAVP